ncbi:hypothetical protein KAU11_04820, partial [Candidatus Babeliales bacterium]|nr:hypothetical protein [Candidatus Babeliales bacterium]
MNTLNETDLNWCVKRIPKSLKKLMTAYSTKLCIGGGYIRSKITGDKTCDIDIFVSSKKVAEDFANYIETDEKLPKSMYTKNAITLFRKGTN